MRFLSSIVRNPENKFIDHPDTGAAVFASRVSAV